VKNTKRKYIESHWLIFALKGALAAFAGICMILSFKNDLQYLTKVAGVALIGMAIVEIFNIFHRKSLQRNWGMPFAISLVEFIAGMALIILCRDGNPNADNIVLRLVIFASFILYASVISIIIGFTCFKNLTDSLFWITQGVIGAILGIATFADNGISNITHIKIFGIYLLVKGLTELYFGIHSKDEMAELHNVHVARSKKISKGKK